MITRRPVLRTLQFVSSQPHTHLLQRQPHRFLHARIPQPPIPSPTPFVPDATTFLTLIGRNLSAHASKIPSWEALFSLTSAQLKDLGVEPPRSRKYLLRWRDKFRNGEFGIGGDLKYVNEGIGEVRLVDVPVSTASDPATPSPVKDGEPGPGADVIAPSSPRATLTRSPGFATRIINVDPKNPSTATQTLRRAKPVFGLKKRGAITIYGPHVEAIKGTGGRAAVIRVKQGLWEHVRGHKVDGGERRKAEVRAKRRSADRKAGRA